jgi:hypothetical protein
VVQIVVDRQRVVGADEGVDAGKAEFGGGVDHLANVMTGDLGFLVIMREGVRVVAERRHRDAVLLAQRAGVVGLPLSEVGAIEVRDAAVLAVGDAGGPAHDLDAVVADFGGVLEDLFEGEVAEDGGDEAELHWVISDGPGTVMLYSSASSRYQESQPSSPLPLRGRVR